MRHHYKNDAPLFATFIKIILNIIFTIFIFTF